MGRRSCRRPCGNRSACRHDGLGESAPSNSVSVTDTGINELSTDEMQDAPIYDLQGRRVLYPERGQIYVTKGRKFIYK